MRRVLPSLIVIALALAVGLTVREQFRARPAQPPAVPDGDYEIAYIHTTTNPQTWERLVAAVFQMTRENPYIQVDDSRAFLDQTAGVPEVVLIAPARPDKLRIRWYKLSSEVGNREWVKALAERSPPPIAFMGGGTSDRATELAVALNERTEWKGQRPLLVITTATANTVVEPETWRPEKLIKLYPDRSFRGCFTNEAMASAVVDFVWQSDELRPNGPDGAHAHVLAWQDDPYSVDLAEQFETQFKTRTVGGKPVKITPERIGYSVGTFTDPNPPEREALDRVLDDLTRHGGGRELLVLPAVTQPARRALRSLAADSPLVGKRLVAVNGDGVSFNTVYRDGDIAWPIRELSIPQVYFAHQNPVAWTMGDGPADTHTLVPPNGTDDVLLFADMIRVIGKALYLGDRVTNADELAVKFRPPPDHPLHRGERFFNDDGERRRGTGEHVIVVKPQFDKDNRVMREALYEIHSRQGGNWQLVRQFIK